MAATLEVKGESASWQTVVPSKPYTKSNIIGIIGPKGNDKSLLLAATIIHKIVEGESVWSNMPVKTSPAILNRRYSPSGKLIKYTESHPLDWDLFYNLDESLVDGTVAIDEIGYQAGARQSSDTRNRLINMCIRQARHRCLDFIYTARTFYRVDYYIREETDILIECKDLCFSPWGLQHKVPGGTVAQLRYFDISGQTTGKSCYDGYRYDSLKYYMERNFYGTPYHDCYDTREIISLEEACTGIELTFKKRRIGNEDRESETASLKEKILDGIASLRKTGKDVIPSFTFWEFMKHTFGLQGDTARLGKFLPRETNRRMSNGVYLYDFAGVDI